MATFTGLLRLYAWHMKLNVSKSMIYRFDFISGIFISILISGIAPFMQYLYFTQTRGYPGWTLNQILLFQGLLLLWFGIRDVLFGDIRGLIMNLVWKGDFDRLLLKPYSPIGVLLCSGFQLNGIGSCLAGLLVTILAFLQLDGSIGLWTFPLLILMTVCGLMLYMAVTITFAAIVIMLIQMGRIGEMFEKIMEFGTYPMNIFPSGIRILMVTILPFAVWTYYPTQILLQRVDHQMWVACAFSLIMFWLSIKLWNRCLRKYTSAGG
ncbi:MAG: ABC-2 family transporter protein [Paenibacillaceae bacterium]